MSNARYIEFDSSYRNRKMWPNPGEFEVPISQSGRKGRGQAVDPYSSSAAIKTWNSNDFNALGGATITMTVDAVGGVGAAGDQQVVIVTGTAGQLQELQNYYKGAVALQAANDMVRISGYRYLGDDRAEVVLASGFTTALAAGSTFTVTDPTDVTPPDHPYFFVPDGFDGTDSYLGHLLYNVTQNEWRVITSYDPVTRLLSLLTNGSNVSGTSEGPITGWALTDTYSIRDAPPSSCFTLAGDVANNPTTHTSFNVPPVSSTTDFSRDFLEVRWVDHINVLTAGGTTSVTLNAIANADDGYYIGCQIRMVSGAASGETSIISAYNGTTKVAVLTPGFVTAAGAADGYHVTCTPQAREIVKYVDYRDTAVGGSINTIEFPATASDINGFYNNLYVVEGADTRLITNYVVTRNGTGAIVSRVATVATNFGAPVVAGDAFTITSGVVAPGFTGSIATNTLSCILPFTADNLNPFFYSGSIVSQQEMVCYEIELLNLSLPNQTLATGIGSRIAFYPYVYVEISNVTAAGAGMKNVIYSNNPNSSRMVFRAAIDDVQNPLISAFVKIDGDGMVQTLKFKPNDNLRFAVRLPNGELYRTVKTDTVGPRRPNPTLQVSAMFSIKRL